MDRLREIEQFWTDRAAEFDQSADHGLLDPTVRKAWRLCLADWLPAPVESLADLGCGTGSLTLLAAEFGADVMGLDLSPAMIEIARQKASAAGIVADFAVGDAMNPGLPDLSQDVVLARHILWTLPDPVTALERWSRIVNDDGRLVLIEGVWATNARRPSRSDGFPWDGGVSAATLLDHLSSRFEQIDHYQLSENDDLWGTSVSDERYAVVAQRPVR